MKVKYLIRIKNWILNLIFLFIIIGFVFSASAAIRKGPYLIYPGDNTKMMVLWQLDVSEPCTLEWGFDTSYSLGNVPVIKYGADYQYKYTIDSLNPGTKYCYRVTESGGFHTGTFRTAPSTSATNVKFLVYGDTRSNPAIHDTVNDAMVSTYTSDPEYQTILLHSGDWVASGDNEADWTAQFFSRTYLNTIQMQANLPINGCKGNHEGTGNLYQKYWPYPYVSNFYWSFDYGPMHITVIDQYTNYSLGSPQLDWITSDLSMSSKEWKFLVFHEPGWSAGGGHPNNTYVQTLIQPLCELYGVDIVFAGHNHYYCRCEVNGIRHLTCGSGGAPLYTPNLSDSYVVTATSAYHFGKIDIQDKVLTFTAVKPDGTVIDEFQIFHPTSATLWELY
jgi:predicted phosphodiesterase